MEVDRDGAGAAATSAPAAADNLEELLNLRVLSSLRQIFSESSVEPDVLPEQEFRDALAQFISREQVDLIYPKIDINDDGNVDWNEFTSFLISSGTFSSMLDTLCLHDLPVALRGQQLARTSVFKFSFSTQSCSSGQFTF